MKLNQVSDGAGHTAPRVGPDFALHITVGKMHTRRDVDPFALVVKRRIHRVRPAMLLYVVGHVQHPMQEEAEECQVAERRVVKNGALDRHSDRRPDLAVAGHRDEDNAELNCRREPHVLGDVLEAADKRSIRKREETLKSFHGSFGEGIAGPKTEREKDEPNQVLSLANASGEASSSRHTVTGDKGQATAVSRAAELRTKGRAHSLRFTCGSAGETMCEDRLAQKKTEIRGLVICVRIIAARWGKCQTLWCGAAIACALNAPNFTNCGDLLLNSNIL